MGALTRLVRLVFGASVDPALRPLLGVSLAGSIAFSAGWTFIGIWAIDELGASHTALGLAFLVGALIGAASGYVGGHISDHRGRRPLMLVGWGGEALFVLAFLTVGDRQGLGLVLIALSGLFGAVGGAASQALVADLVPVERHEAAYASVRVAANLGVTMGPPVGGGLLLLGSWSALFAGVSAMAAVAFLLALRLLPRTGAYAPDAPPERGSFAVIRRDRSFLLFLVSGSLAYFVYVAYEVVLPISLVDTHGIAPSTWGFLVVINPALVTLFQLRLTRRAAGIPPAPKLVAAMLLMGLPFLLLSVSAALPVVAFVIAVFVVGEMLWVPTSQAIVAGLAPEDVRGAYMGAFGSTSSFGFALAPFLGLQVRGEAGDTAMWAFFAATSVLAALTGAAACRVVGRRTGRRQAPAPVPS